MSPEELATQALKDVIVLLPEKASDLIRRVTGLIENGINKRTGQIEELEAKNNRLKAILAGYDRCGDGKQLGGGWACTCRWSSSVHGENCPEHGVAGVPILSRVIELEAENAYLRTKCSDNERRIKDLVDDIVLLRDSIR